MDPSLNWTDPRQIKGLRRENLEFTTQLVSRYLPWVIFLSSVRSFSCRSLMGKLFDAFEGLVEEQEPACELEHTPEDSLHV